MGTEEPDAEYNKVINAVQLFVQQIKFSGAATIHQPAMMAQISADFIETIFEIVGYRENEDRWLPDSWEEGNGSP